MPLPASLSVINVRATYLKPNGLPESGKVIVYTDTVIQSTTDKIIVGPLYFEGTLDAFGYVSIDVPATNDPEWAPLNYTYHVKEVLSTGVRSYYIAVPYNQPSLILDLATAAPVQNNPDPTMYVLVSQGNALGGYAKIDSVTGKIPANVVPPGGGNADGSFKGTWSSTSAYIIGDTVIRTGLVYGALQNNTNQLPEAQPAFWQVYPTDPAIGTALAAKAPIASPTFTGLVTAPRLVLPPVALTPAVTVLVNATTGNVFRLTPTANFTLGNPSGAVDGQMIMFEITQDATGNRVMTLDTKYNLGTFAAPVLSTLAGKRDILGVRYHGAADKFDLLAFEKGY